MKAARCGAPGIYGQEHIGKHGKGRRRGGGGVQHGHMRNTMAPDTWGPSVSKTRGSEAGDAAAGPGDALGRGSGNWDAVGEKAGRPDEREKSFFSFQNHFQIQI